MLKIISSSIQLFVLLFVGWLILKSLIMAYQERAPAGGLHFMSTGLALVLSLLVARGLLNSMQIFSWETLGQTAAFILIRTLAKKQLMLIKPGQGFRQPLQ